MKIVNGGEMRIEGGSLLLDRLNKRQLAGLLMHVIHLYEEGEFIINKHEAEKYYSEYSMRVEGNPFHTEFDISVYSKEEIKTLLDGMEKVQNVHGHNYYI